MNHQWVTGIAFGMTSGVITTLGLMVGLHAGTHSRAVVLGGIFTIAVADAMSDALGVHVSEESRPDTTSRQIWTTTAATFLAKLGMALTFAVPVLLAELPVAIIVSVVWGFLVLALLSFGIARRGKERPLPVIAEHVGIAAVVIFLTHYVGDWTARFFGA